jgi:Domain of unknown function (DUF4159)
MDLRLRRFGRRAIARAPCGLVVVSLAAAAAMAQGRGFGGFGFGGPRIRNFKPSPNTPYDGRFNFVRIIYDCDPSGYWYRGLPAWAHGYPMAEGNLMKIMNEVSYFGAQETINTVTLDDPELFRYAVAYIIEVSWWQMTDAQAAALRAYMQKGGFVIVDDFKTVGWRGNGTGGWEPFERNMERVFPGVKFFDMDEAHPIFHAFFEIGGLEMFPQAYNSGRPVFKGVYEGNDPSKRLVMIVNYNTDISQFWEWSGRGLRPVDDTNEAYKLGVNYLFYGMTH